MRKRPFLLATAGIVAGLAVFQTVAAQTPLPVTAARPSTEWTPPPNTAVYPTAMVPPTGVRPTGGYTPQPKGNAVQPAVGQQGRPRLSTAVIAGADGVRPASAFDIPQGNTNLPASIPVAGGTLPPPSLAMDVSPTAQPLPQPALSPPDLGVAPPAAVPAIPVLPPIATNSTPVTPQPNGGDLAIPVSPTTAPPTLPQLPTTPVPAVETPTTPISRPASVSPGTLAAKLTQTVTLEAVCPESVVFGGEFRYELIVKNSGTVPVVGVRIEDELPAGAKYVGSEPAAELNADRLSWAVGTLDAGAEKRIAVRVKPVEEGDLRSRATVSYSASVEARTKVTRPRIGVLVTGPEVAKAGEEPTFQIKVTNTGTGPAQKMVLQAFLSDGLVHPAGVKLEMEMASLPPGESKIVPLKVSATKAGAQWCQVVVAAQGSQDATAKASVNVLEPLLQIAQTGPAKCLVRAEPVYEITLANPGTAVTDPVSVYAVLPEGFEYLQGSDGATFNAANRAVVWKISGLAPGGSKAFTLKLRATAESDGQIRTIAQAIPEQPAQGIAAAGGVARPAGRVLEAKTETAIKAEGVAAVRFDVLDLDDPVEVGKEATYEVRVTNQGTGACTNVQLVAAMAEGCTFTGSSGPTQVKAQGQTLTFEPIPNLGVKGEAVYRLKIRGATAGDIRFRVQLACDQVRNPVVKEESTRFVKP